MTTFNEANQVRIALKMKLSQYSWYTGSVIAIGKEEYFVVINTKKFNSDIKKQVPPVFNGVTIKIEIDK
jgi:hypothetical protein